MWGNRGRKNTGSLVGPPVTGHPGPHTAHCPCCGALMQPRCLIQTKMNVLLHLAHILRIHSPVIGIPEWHLSFHLRLPTSHNGPQAISLKVSPKYSHNFFLKIVFVCRSGKKASANKQRFYDWCCLKAQNSDEPFSQARRRAQSSMMGLAILQFLSIALALFTKQKWHSQNTRANLQTTGHLFTTDWNFSLN